MGRRLSAGILRTGISFLSFIASVIVWPGIAAAEGRFLATQPAVRIEYWQKREAQITKELADKAHLPAVRLVFLGDSITDFWSLDENPWMPGRYCGRQLWDETFAGKDPRLTSINLGISGDRTEHALQRLLPRAQGGGGELDAPELQPDAVVLLIGINNSWAAESPAADSVYAGVVAVIESVHARKPMSRIVLQTLLPTNERARNREVVEPVNARLIALAQDKSRGYLQLVDLHADFVDAQGEQITEYFNDGLHPSLAGYRVWRDRLVRELSNVH